MKPLIKWIVYFLLLWIAVWSCKKEKPEQQQTIVPNHAPDADAGTDQTIILPTNAVTLDGSYSTDPDNNIDVYQWAKIFGPDTYNITDASASITVVENLVDGLYQFELTVKDKGGLKSKDTVNVSLFSVISASFTEEFDTVYLLESKGWMRKKNTGPGTWVQGHTGRDKAGVSYGFPAYSFTTSEDEFVYASVVSATIDPNSFFSVSSWLITPILSVKNGDKFSFYTRSDSGNVYADRLQILMSPSGGNDIGTTNESVGDFTDLLLDINEAHVVNDYPKTWTKYEYIFSGISSPVTIRIAFRYFIQLKRARGVGIDLFRFEKF